MKERVFIFLVFVALVTVWIRHDRNEPFRVSFRNPFKGGFRSPVKFSRGKGTKNGAEPNNTTPKPDGSDGVPNKGTSDPWLKAGTIFGGLDLALTPLWFIPMGGGGGDAGGDGEAAGAAAQDPTSSISSSSSSSSSLLMLMMLVVLVLVAAT